MTQRQLQNFKRKYLREGYKMAIKEMAFSSNFNKDDFYSKQEQSFNKKLADNEADYKKRRESLLKKLDDEYKEQQTRHQKYYNETKNFSKIAEKFAEAMPCEIDDMKVDGDEAELIVNDKNCPVKAILIRKDYYYEDKIAFRFMDYKKHMYASVNSHKLKPIYKEIQVLVNKCDSYTWDRKLEAMPFDEAISTVSNTLTKIMNLYNEIKKGDPSLNVNYSGGNLTTKELKKLLINGKHSTWREDIFAYLGTNEINEFLRDLVNLINDNFGGNATNAILNSDTWYTIAEEAVYEEGEGDYDNGVAMIEKERKMEEFGYYDGTYIFVKKRALKR